MNTNHLPLTPKQKKSAIFWPLFVVILLGITMLGSMSVLWIATSDGGAKVEEAYYQQAVDWDKMKAEQALSKSLGWHVALDVKKEENATQLFVTLHDKDKKPLTQKEGAVKVFRPDKIQPIAEAKLISLDEAGRYQATLKLEQTSIWDIDIMFKDTKATFQERVRVSN